MRIAVSGSTGLIGSALVRSLEGDGHEVLKLVRHEPGGPAEVQWDPARQWVDGKGLEGCDAVVHLAAKSIGMRRWTEQVKREHWESRVHGTSAIAEAIASLESPPAVFLCASAIGWYGETGDRKVDESAPAGEGFLADMCQAWEAATEPAAQADVRTVNLRTGLVVAKGAGAWGRLFPIFRAGLGGRLGNGRQYWSFIALHDQIAAIRHLLDTDWLAGPVNLTAPEPVTNREVTAAMGRALHRPALFPVPPAALKLLLGDFATDALGSQRVIPKRLLESGFSFAFPGVDEAVRAALRS